MNPEHFKFFHCYDCDNETYCIEVFNFVCASISEGVYESCLMVQDIDNLEKNSFELKFNTDEFDDRDGQDFSYGGKEYFFSYCPPPEDSFVIAYLGLDKTNLN